MPAKKLPGTIFHLFGSFIILIAIVLIGLNMANPAHAWAWILVLVAAFAVLNGHGITGALWGVIIDSRNKMSLSRLQMLVWTLIVISGLAAAILWNVQRSDSPMDITIPSGLWVLLGISTASAVGAPAVLSSKDQKQADPAQLDKTSGKLKEQVDVTPDKEHTGIVVRNKDIGDARFSDLLKGDEVGNAYSLDLGKLQMFFFTFILAAGYGAAIYAMLQKAMSANSGIDALPPVQEGMNVLLGISQTGYLAVKATTSSKEKPAESNGGGK